MSIVIIGKGLVVGAVAATALVAGNATPHTPADASSADAKVACHRFAAHAPDELKKDLAAARKLPKGDERRSAVKKIHKDALGGHYGKAVQTFAQHRKEQRKLERKKLVEQAPAQLRADIKAARKHPADQRRAAILKVWKSALDGTYGDSVQQLVKKRVEHRKEHRAECKAQREERNQTKSS